MPNHLVHETSPYLLQHANNPVDWYPWGAEALQKARDENKPIFLSIGYAACHWCHVMEHESFTDPVTAELLNQHFVSIKVDREERPDLDGLYMSAVVAMTGQGGWPMSIFLTPQGEPFYGGTYFPPVRRYNMPAFREVLEAITQAWQNEGEEMRRVGQQLAAHLRESNTLAALAGPAAQNAVLRPNLIQQAAQALLNTYEWEHGGWGRAPRFPQSMAIEFLLMQAARGSEKALQAAVHALEQMSRGGMYDLIGGGFHRYSVDDEWLVPHFEKMLYDNAQLALVYLHAHLLTGSESFRHICTETLDFVLREMTHPDGGFYSSLDADSEGQEGKFYSWSRAEILSLLNEDERALLEQVAPLPARGNFEGALLLQYTDTPEKLASSLNITPGEFLQKMDAIYARLRPVRAARVRPATDDKVLVSWNALALRAFAEAGRYLQREDYLAAARKNADFLLRSMMREGRLLRAWRDGQARHNAYLEDYAGLILALLALYQSDPNPRWFGSALELAETMLANFRDPDGGFFDTGADHEVLLARPKDVQDNATPSGNALAALALLQLSAYHERGDWHAVAEGMLVALQDLMVKHAMAFGMWLQALDFATGPVQQVAIVGPLADAQTRQLLDTVWSAYRPRMVVAAAPPQSGPEAPHLLRDRDMLRDAPTAYVCQGFTCRMPVTDVEGLRKQLEGDFYQE